MSKLPHLLLFNPDQFRSDALGHLGNQMAQTPSLDKHVDEEALSFVNAFVQNPVCTPSRCSFMTGWYPHVRGHRTMMHLLQPGEPCLLKILKDAGYFVVWAGKNDLVAGQHGWEAYADLKIEKKKGPHRNLHHWNEWRGAKNGPEWYSFLAGKLQVEAGYTEYDDGDWSSVHGVIEFLENFQGEKPVCLYLPLSYPHPPYGVEEPYFSSIDRSKAWPRLPIPKDDLHPSLMKGIREKQNLSHYDEDKWTELRATYLGMCARIDHQFSMVREALIKKNYWKDTASFVFSDHGDFTGDYHLVEKAQNIFTDNLVKVPFIFKPPAAYEIKPGLRHGQIELVDLSATIFELAKIKPEYTSFGQSLVPYLAKDQAGRDAVFCEGGRLPFENSAKDMTPTKSGAEEDSLYWPRSYWQIQDGSEHGKALMCRTTTYKYVMRLLEVDELYDLKKDPGELENLIHDPTLTEVIATLKTRCLRFYMETSDVVPHALDKRDFLE